MILNRFERLLMNNPVRATIQRHFEAKRLLRLGGPMDGGTALEIGCGRGAGVEIILDLFGPDSVHACDLDPRMAALAAGRFRASGASARVWVSDATSIPAADSTYEAVFDFGIIHHVPQWRRALAEVYRVLKPGGRFYAEEALRGFVDHPITRLLTDHPRGDRFDHPTFCAAVAEAGFNLLDTRELWRILNWVVADKPNGE